MIARFTASVLLLIGAALWPGPTQAVGAGCRLAGAGSPCPISNSIPAPGEAHAAVLRSESFMSMLELDQSQENSMLSPNDIGALGSDAGGPSPFAAGPTLVYDMDADDTWVKMPSSAAGALSFALDNFDSVLMPTAAQSELLSDRLSQSTSGPSDNDRPEKWVTVTPKPSVAWLLVLSLAVVALRRVPLRFAPRES